MVQSCSKLKCQYLWVGQPVSKPNWLVCNLLCSKGAIKWADSSPPRFCRGSARIRADFRRTSGGSAGCTFRADSSGPAADSAEVRRGPKNPPRICCGSATSTRLSGGFFFQKINFSPLVLANLCSLRINVTDPLRIHQNSLPRIRGGLESALLIAKNQSF